MWIVKKIIDFFFAVPLDIIQDFGAFGVSLFFLLSGFLFTYNGNYKNEAKLFYNDNNYYVIYKSEKDNVYCADCCCSVISDAVRNDIYIPTPASVNLSKEISELYDNDKDSLVGFMFDNVSFDDAVKFYSRMSEEYVTIDKTNKKITVSGFHNKDKKILDKFFTMDWNNRTYSYTDMEGKNIVYDEKGYHEQ